MKLNLHIQRVIAGEDPPHMKTQTNIIARSPSGQTVMIFESKERAQRWMQNSPDHTITWFRQTITEEQVQIII